MTFGEFTEKVGVISLLVSDSEYSKIFNDYNNSELHKDDFLDAWREVKKHSLHKASRQTLQIARAAFFLSGRPMRRYLP